MQKQEGIVERPALEVEKSECRALECKAAELEEELKCLSNLQADTQCLQDFPLHPHLYICHVQPLCGHERQGCQGVSEKP